ncbi:hypothetical protein LTR95_004388 [Oleoguttula sp. CCFEE 5521]
MTIFRIRAWLKDCTRKHRGVCEELDDKGSGSPVWLIDIEEHCLVPYVPGMQYIALSYVWGQVKTAQTTAANLASLRRPHSLLGPYVAVQLPKTVRDAMYLTGLLTRRYLWCDRLCIVQDDQESKHSQIAQMAMTYARSFCTIIALDGLDADAGIHGIPNLNDLEKGTHDNLEAPSNDRIWQGRGWTFQEEMFPVRLIWLSHDRVSWQCISQYHAAHGGGDGPIEIRSVPQTDWSEEKLNVGGFQCPRSFFNNHYEALVVAYSRRAFSDHAPDDRYNAFSGIQRVMETTIAEPFVQGIPFRLLSHYLLWTSADISSSRRRLAHHGSIAPPPSWSWTGWLTPIAFPTRTPEGDDYDVSLVTWRRDGESLATAPSIEPWMEYLPVKPGFAPQLGHISDPTSRPDLDVVNCDGPSGPQDLPPPLSRSLLLRGRVLLASFKLRSHVPPVSMLVTLVTGARQDFAGVLYESNANVCNDRDIYVLAISSGSHAIDNTGELRWRKALDAQDAEDAYERDKRRRQKELDQYPEYFVEPRPKTYMVRTAAMFVTKLDSLMLDKEYLPGSIYEYYNVMWVEWETGIAYRKGLARIAKEVFERECLGWMDVTLG